MRQKYFGNLNFIDNLETIKKFERDLLYYIDYEDIASRITRNITDSHLYFDIQNNVGKHMIGVKITLDSIYLCDIVQLDAFIVYDILTALETIRAKYNLTF